MAVIVKDRKTGEALGDLVRLSSFTVAEDGREPDIYDFSSYRAVTVAVVKSGEWPATFEARLAEVTIA